MPETVLPRAPHEMAKFQGYAKLLKAVRNTLLLGRERIEREKVLTYWKTGKHIQNHLLLHKDRAEYGREVVEKLSEDVEVHSSVLWRTLQFVEKFPILATWRESSKNRLLSWSHYRELFAVPDEKERFRLATEAGRGEWTTAQLVQRIRKELPKLNGKNGPHSSMASPSKEISSFKPKRGIVGAYQVVMADVLLLDLGFSNFMEQPALKSGRFKEGDIVSAVGARPPRPLTSGGGTPPLRLAKDATPADLFTYSAEVEKVIDADTLWLWIHIGFNIWMRQKVRLRGIDAPEINTKAGLAAKRFVESQLESAGPLWPVTVTTTKPDKFDRYLSDVWIGDVNLNKLLLETGHARLMPKVSDDRWDDSNWGRF